MASTVNKSILDSIGEGIIIIDKDFNILETNIGGQNTVGKKCYEVACCGSTDVDCPISEVLKTGKSSTKMHICNENGDKSYLEITIYPLVEGKNNGSFVHMERDVTERETVSREIREYISVLSKRVGKTTVGL